MRNEERVRLNLINELNKYEPHSSLTRRTCEALAVSEVHTLHAFGEHDLVDGACGREGEEREKDKVRDEEACAAESQKRIK